ncbi:phosphate ABC transporter substrate-binding protein PstS [Actinacidiphila glaucinigra]|uniref:phosphate ABC transporter substrate-binding protein PstS n=1 Tax=Actinacidiphila glaucinigra TaxID=235986 RepID=UPI002DDA03EB|nr:phosphate ABC transporter substrate-binding protein PstS [Actinacidiphila glaucinigra]WSD62030.1 phosphate ABC transporter substrate-binding protein PstS [Actinacidiphila glaucinigra]
MPGARPAPSERSRVRALTALALMLAAMLFGASLPVAEKADAATYVPIAGVGSTWSQNAIDQWTANVQMYNMKVTYTGTGSSDGRNQYRNGTVDFAVSEIPYGIKDSGVVDTPPRRKYAYMPIVAGGTAFMYNLKIGNRQVTNLRLSGEVITKIFTGVIKTWNDPAIKKDNPALAASLPARPVVPVVRSDGSGTTAQFTTWMAKQYGGLWDDYCRKAGRATPCGTTSIYPKISGSPTVAQAGSNGVSGYVAAQRNVGTITYVEYSYAKVTTKFPVVKVLNKAGYYVEPTDRNVAVALLKAQIDDKTLTQKLDGVYNDTDRRTYPLSSYSYMIVPTKVENNFSKLKGRTLGAFAYYFLCEGQKSVGKLGFSPLPINLVKAGLDQVRRIPGVDVESIDVKNCQNPTFSTDGTNTLAKKAPYPADCDKQGGRQCATGTGGNMTSTVVRGGSGSSGGSGSGGSGGSGSGTSGGTAGSKGGSSTGATGGNADGTSSGGTDASPSVDPDTGQVVTNDGSTGASGGEDGAYSTAVTTAGSIGGGTRRALMVLAAVLLLALTVAPPLLTSLLNPKRRRS